MRTSSKENLRNRMNRSRIRTFIKKLQACQNKVEAEPILRTTFSILDKSLKTGLLHPNNVANKKSRLTKLVNALAE
jgi:small subunit ribosomal protein S20